MACNTSPPNFTSVETSIDLEIVIKLKKLGRGDPKSQRN